MRATASTALWCVAAVLVLVSCTSTQNQTDETATSSPTAGPSSTETVEPADDPVAAAQRSVVSVQVGGSRIAGLVVTADGHIVISNSIVAGSDGADMPVTFSNGGTGQAAIVGGDARSHLTVIKTDETPAVEPAAFGDSDGVEVGDEVLMLGPPTAGGTATAGAVSATNRFFDGISTIEIDVAAPLGTGPVINAAGEVVGIVVATISTPATNSESLEASYAVPSNIATRVVEQLIAGGQVAYPSLGVAIQDAADGGALVQDVIAGSPAQQAGLQPGDVITRLGDRTIDSAAELLSAVLSSGVGDELTVVFIRDGSERETVVTLGQAPARRGA